jgi:hypothetical protein
MQPNDTTSRTTFINALRDLADFLTDYPDLPEPGYGQVINVFPEGDTETERRTGVEDLAALLGVTPMDKNGHYCAEYSVGPIVYCVVAISDHARAIHAAESSYHGCVTPATDTPTVRR